MKTAWDDEREVRSIDLDGISAEIEVPDWIDQDITVSQLMAIRHGGCASGAYMPAVTYYKAKETMGEHGDDVLEYIERSLGELPQPPASESWSGIACFYLSAAVELWASETLQTLGIED